MMNSRLVSVVAVWLASVVLLILLARPAFAQEPDPTAADDDEATIEELRKLVTELKFEVDQMRGDVERMRAEMRELRTKLLLLRSGTAPGPPQPQGGPVKFTVAGTVVFVARAGRVDKGDLLIELDRTEALTNLAEFQDRLVRSGSSIRIAQRWLAEAQGKVTHAQIMWDQAKVLVRDVAQEVRAGNQPEAALQAAQARASEGFRAVSREKGRLLGREVHLRNCQQGIPQLEEAIEHQKRIVEQLRIVAPADGTVSNVRVETGTHVSPADVVLDFTPGPASTDEDNPDDNPDDGPGDQGDDE